MLESYRTEAAAREPERATLVARGVAFLTVVVLLVMWLFLLGRGTFDDRMEATVLVDSAGGALVEGSDVKYRGVLVGKVAGIRDAAESAGKVEVAVDLEPTVAEEVPGNVMARVLPASVFGTSFVDLVTRRPAMVGGGTVTIVSANHGRGIEGAGDYLTREEALADLCARISGPDRRLPRHFQVLLRVEMIDFDQEVVEVDYLTHPGRVDLPEAMRHLREERGVRALLCEGGPHLHGQLEAAALVDELFLTIAPKLNGGEGPPSLVEGELPRVIQLQLLWLLEKDGELFARYRRP